MSNAFFTEILEQPATLLRAAAGAQRQLSALEAARRLGERATHVVLTGMGSSHDVCLAAASVLGSDAVLASTVNTAELVHYRLPSLDERTLVVAVSQSGRSAEVVRLARDLRAATARPALISVTNGVANELACTADVALDTCAGQEVGPSTKSYAASCVTLAALTRVLAGHDPTGATEQVASGAVQAAHEATRLLSDPDWVADLFADWLGDRTSLMLVGRGTARAAAEMGALVLKEAAGFAAESLDAAEFRHGPLEMAGPRLAVAVLAAEPATNGLDQALAAEVAAHGSAVFLLTCAGEAAVGPEVTSEHDGAARADLRTLPIASLDRMLAPAVSVIPFQLLAWRLAVRSGREPGLFLAAAKVTTRE